MRAAASGSEHPERVGEFSLRALVKLNPNSNGIDPVSEPVVVQVGNSPISIPAGSFAEDASGDYTFHGKINATALDAVIAPPADGRGFVFASYGYNPSLKEVTSSPLPINLVVGNDVATADVTASLN